MKLSELFVSHKQVDPVSFNLDAPELPKTIYFNLDRAQKAASPETNNEDISTWKAENGTYNWKVGYKHTPKDTPKQEDVQVPYRAEHTPTNSSRNLLEYIKEKENFIPTVYQDSGGVSTIGYGFTNPEILKKGRLTEQEASDLLLKDIEERKTKLKSQITTWDKLNQNQQDALTSYGFNVGVENWKKNQPKLLAALNEGRFKDAAKYIDVVTDKSGTVLPGLVKRRQEEREWFNS